MIIDALQSLAVPLSDLKPMPGNPRRGDIEAVVRSYQRFGQRKPIVARRDGTVIAGNHQLQAAQRMGWVEIAVVFVDDDDLTAKAFALADNRVSDLGTYDNAALSTLLYEIAEDADLLAAAGYHIMDLDALDSLTAVVSDDAGIDIDLDEVEKSLQHNCPSCGFKW